MEKPAAGLELETALLIIPPPEVQLFASPLMQRYAPERFALGPAHLTLFYPFFKHSKGKEAIPLLHDICRHIPPVQITLDHYERFPAVCYLAPADPEPVQALFLRIQKHFPSIQPFEGKFGPELIPHLTLAECSDVDNVTLPPPPSFTFTIDRLTLFLGYPFPSPWVPYEIFHLQG